MKSVVITEGESDIALLKALMGTAGDTVEFVKAGGWSSADSLARSYLVDGQHDVALVVDADSYDSSTAEDRKRFLKASLASVALRTRWEVFVFMPEIEILFFQDREFLETLLGKPISETIFQQGQFEPKKVLLQLLSGRSQIQFFQERLPNFDLTPLQNQADIAGLRHFLTQTRKKAAA